ncbi:MAG TPA: RNA polymerase subunit sigma-24 [Ruminococcus sp.]|nr:RNA polymerase subunit sigma-24 [Ruminococcus sp.]
MTDSEYRLLMEKSPDAAQRALFDEYYRYVYAVVFGRLRRTASREDIEECVSDVFSEVYFRCSSPNTRNGELKGLIGSIADRTAIDMYNRLSSHSRISSSVEEGAADHLAAPDDVEGEADHSLIRRKLLDCIKSLGEPDSSIILLRYYYGISSGETAKELSMTPAAVRKRCSRAAKKLREMLSAEGITL